MPAAAYSRCISSDSAQKCGGVQTKTIVNSQIASQLTSFGHRRDADHRRDRPGRAADHDVERRPALQPAGVDEDVEQQREQRQRRPTAGSRTRPSA